MKGNQSHCHLPMLSSFSVPRYLFLLVLLALPVILVFYIRPQCTHFLIIGVFISIIVSAWNRELEDSISAMYGLILPLLMLALTERSLDDSASSGIYFLVLYVSGADSRFIHGFYELFFGVFLLLFNPSIDRVCLVITILAVPGIRHIHQTVKTEVFCGVLSSILFLYSVYKFQSMMTSGEYADLVHISNVISVSAITTGVLANSMHLFEFLNAYHGVISAAVFWNMSVFVYFYIFTLFKEEPFYWLFSTLLRNQYTIVFWIISLIFVVPLAPILKKSLKLSTVTARKLFHILAAVLFLPSIMMGKEQPVLFLHFSLVVVFFLFVFVEVIRGFSPGSNKGIIMSYFEIFFDKRDIYKCYITSHIYLLLGCALPIWTSVLLHKTDDIFFMSIGIVTVAIGDAAAAIVGFNFGRVKWYGSHKSIAGSLAGFLSKVFACYVVERSQSNQGQIAIQHSSPIFLVLILLTTLEAVTNDPDNILLPVYGMVLIMIMRELS